MRCPRCGNENSGGNRFCGMCGASLIASPAPTAATPAAPSGEKKEEAAGGRFSDEPRLPARSAPAAPPEPSVAGPSFLGLNKPADSQRGRQDLHGRSSRSVDYLLDDEDNEPNGGRGKIALVLIALVLAGVFGYLYWRQGGFDWVLKDNKAPAAQSSPAEPAPGAAPSPATSDSSANGPPAPSSAASGNPASQPAANDASGTPAQQNPSGATSTPPAQPETPAANTASQAAAPDNDAAPAAEKSSPEKTSADKSSTEKSADADDDSNSEPAETAKPSPAPKKIRKPTPATPLDISAEADRYIYGRGVPQDCDRGLKLLKSAAQYDPKAMIKMGVLYSSGTCAPRDLPTAYRWFAMALHKDPNNQAVQDDLQQLWGQMTQPERQLAIKLSQ